MPPELLHGTKSSSKSDMYSVGATVYELHFGEPPPPPPRKRQIPADKNLGELLQLLLQSDPRARPSATQALTLPYFTALEGSRECEICLEESLVELGVLCAHQDTHFFCRSCFEDHVSESSDVKTGMEKFRQKDGNILCPNCSETFSPAKIASCVRPEVLEQFMEARKLLLQQLEQERAQHKVVIAEYIDKIEDL